MMQQRCETTQQSSIMKQFTFTLISKRMLFSIIIIITQGGKRRKKRKLAHEKAFLDKLPSAEMYEKSYMHRTTITHLLVTNETDFIVTASQDGHVKFWKKMSEGIEFVKHFHAHLGEINDMVASNDGLRLCTTSSDRTVKFFDVSV
jgi:peptidylprolyl isomerase domain and WD repeat-containing protein 1